MQVQKNYMLKPFVCLVGLNFFKKYGVSDDVDGRFDALSLVVILVMRRLKSLDESGKALSQDLFDSMFADMDLSLREMGAG